MSDLPPVARWNAYEILLDNLLDLTIEQRPALLATAGVGHDLERGEVEQILRDGEREAILLDKSAFERFASMFSDEPKPPPPVIAGRYSIVREVGRGGMARVFLAHDLKHRRDVAIKIVDAEVTALVTIDRFFSEIRVTAQLQHAHIVPVFDSGEVEGQVYFVMPFVSGESLRDRLEHQSTLPLDEALSIAHDVASALDYAHRCGFIHRDIKPENILLHNGQAVVADFGIAMALDAAARSRLTGWGASSGRRRT